MFAALGDFVSGVGQEEHKDETEDEHKNDGSSHFEGCPKKVVVSEGSSKRATMNFWSVASALTDSVKQRTAELAASIQETDWRKELGAFQQGLKEDSEELQHRTKEAVEHLPTVVEQLQPEKTSALLQAKAKEAQQQLQLAGKSLGNFGQKLMLGTTELFDQVKDAIQAEMAFDSRGDNRVASKRQLVNVSNTKFSRFEADVNAMQRDSSTYCDEPEDEDDYVAWLASFDLEVRRPDVDALIASNTFMAELQARIVPVIVEYDAFWTRYFYRLHKLQQKHDQIIQLTQRVQEEEEVGWGSEEEGDTRLTPRDESQVGCETEVRGQGQATGNTDTHVMPDTDSSPGKQQGQGRYDELAAQSTGAKFGGLIEQVASTAMAASQPSSGTSNSSPASEIGAPSKKSNEKQVADKACVGVAAAITESTSGTILRTSSFEDPGTVEHEEHRQGEGSREAVESELSDFDVDDEEVVGDDAVDEDWGEDWE